jgi:hypothetical protein
MDLTILNGFTILTSWGSKLSHPQFRLTLVRVSHPKTRRQWRQAQSMSQLKRVDSRHNSHWLMQCTKIRCHVCSAKNKETSTICKCQECNTRLCATPYVKVYHTKLHFWEPAYTKMDTQNTPL